MNCKLWTTNSNCKTKCASALEIVKLQKKSARGTELAVQKFKAEVLKSQSMEYDINQNIKETENRINFFIRSFPQEITRDKLLGLVLFLRLFMQDSVAITNKPSRY
jgi:hypothetical protein